ncbi:MAG: cysteine--tRNA ligase [Oscillospiraceae bacterium]|nr:cysteine--tRNA ligase [Oscillospiraceae bacterium]
MKIYNTLTKTKEEFKPINEEEVRMYSCGPTVYNYAHIGNLRAYIFMDLLSKTLRADGYKLKHVMNITDVGHLTSDADEGEDKVQKAARAQNKDPYEIVNFYTEVFLKDIESLNIRKPDIISRATEHIPEMIEYVQKIVENGYGYETSTGVYFDISKLPSYGILSNKNIEGEQAGARVAVDKEKRNPLDFAIWIKAPENHIMKWESPWGLCFPGWHIECSAMSKKYLGEQFDIHTGGVDHIPIHHENEIAQSMGYCGKIPANYWMHCEFLLVDDGKMSKSLGNVYTLEDLRERGFSPLDFRYLCLSASYRNKLNFTFESLKSAKTGLERLRNAVEEHENGTVSVSDEEMTKYKNQFLEVMNDDLDTPKAMNIVWEIARKVNKSKQYAELISEMDEILGIDISVEKIATIREMEEKIDILATLDDETKQLIQEREVARANKDWAKSDEIREKLTKKGISVKDTKEGMEIKRM